MLVVKAFSPQRSKENGKCCVFKGSKGNPTYVMPYFCAVFCAVKLFSPQRSTENGSAGFCKEAKVILQKRFVLV